MTEPIDHRAEALAQLDAATDLLDDARRARAGGISLSPPTARAYDALLHGLSAVVHAQLEGNDLARLAYEAANEQRAVLVPGAIRVDTDAAATARAVADVVSDRMTRDSGAPLGRTPDGRPRAAGSESGEERDPRLRPDLGQVSETVLVCGHGCTTVSANAECPKHGSGSGWGGERP